jgi:hypothetical protein
VVGCRDPCPGRHQRRHLGAAVLELDTSARPGPGPRRALVLTDWIIDELHEVVGRKRPDLLAALDAFLDGIDYELASLGDPSVPISDPDDQPILDAAVSGAVDVIVTRQSLPIAGPGPPPNPHGPALSGLVRQCRSTFNRRFRGAETVKSEDGVQVGSPGCPLSPQVDRAVDG